jgi:hypothetical protein
MKKWSKSGKGDVEMLAIENIIQYLKETVFSGDKHSATVSPPANPEVQRALENYQAAVNRYNFSDLSDPNMENLCFLERQLAYAALQVALAKARLLAGSDPALDYSCFAELSRRMVG